MVRSSVGRGIAAWVVLHVASVVWGRSVQWIVVPLLSESIAMSAASTGALGCLYSPSIVRLFVVFVCIRSFILLSVVSPSAILLWYK